MDFNSLGKSLTHPFVIWQWGAIVLVIVIIYSFKKQIIAQTDLLKLPKLWKQILDLILRRILSPLLITIFLFIAQIGFHEIFNKDPKIIKLTTIIFFALTIIRISVIGIKQVFFRSIVSAKLERIISLLIWVIVVLYIVGWSAPIVQSMMNVSISIGATDTNLWSIIKGIITTVVTVFVAMWSVSLIEKTLINPSQISSSVKVLFSRLLKSGLLVFAILFSLSIVGFDLTSLSIIGGALGVGIGFGLQKIASNFISGFIILLDKSIRPGDYLIIGDKQRGWVSKITMRYTVINNRIGDEFIVPNETLVNEIVQNRTYSDTEIMVTQSIGVAYSSKMRKVVEVIESTIKTHRLVLKSIPPRAYLTGFGDSSVNFEFSYWVGRAEYSFRDTRSEINLLILEAFAQNEINIPFPQRELRILPEQK